MTTYKIVRVYQDDRPKEILRRGLSLEKAQEWCDDDQTSSMTARKPKGCASDEAQIKRWHKKNKHWFDGFERE